MAAEEGESKSDTDRGAKTDEAALAEPPGAVTGKGRERHDAPRAEPFEADEFGLPLKPPRRRNYALDELESPEDVKVGVIEKMKDLAFEKTGVKRSSPAAGPDEGTVESGEREPSEPTPAETTTENEQTVRVNTDVPDAERKSDSHPPSGYTPQKPSVSEWSHQQLAPQPDEEEVREEEGQWQEMPALAEHRMYDDWGKVIAKSYEEVPDDLVTYANLGGAGKGYTRVQMDDDAQSATSLDENTAYLFKDQYVRNTLDVEDEEGRDPVTQMNTTKELLTEAQRIAYVGVVRLSIMNMAQELEALDKSKGSKRQIEYAAEHLKMWGQKMMVRLYQHMEIDSREQIMVEQLAEHGVQASDLTHTLMQNARVRNPKVELETSSLASSVRPSVGSPRPSSSMAEKGASATSLSVPNTPARPDSAPPAYEEHKADELTVQDPSELTSAKHIDLDLRWTVLCDLFLLLIADSTYDARSRTLLERVGSALSVEWQEICRFEKRVTDALEMQEHADKENWNEDEHMKSRERRARNTRLMVMGLCTVGGGLIIGLSAGALAPVIGAGLAAGFTTIGVAGTGSFLGGAGAAALIGTTGTLIGGGIGMKTSHRRTGAVKTFEYKPLYNNKRVNLVVTIAGWMAGSVDDVRLPFSTVDPVMGDIYAVNWEPEMLQSTGQTIQILGTEALTQTIQQILGATFLSTLMAGLSLPIVLTKLSYLIDNPWTVSLARADATGLILADSLIDRNLGVRPITLVGFSLGSRVIFSCLKELAKRGAIGLIQNVYMFGSPVVVKKEEWMRTRSVVSGRFINGFAKADWILAYLFRATSGGIMRIAGLGPVNIPGVENIDVTEWVPGHMAYRGMMPTLLHQVGWPVESEEFTEIEDPDPENHEKRQRELIHEIEEARAQLEEKPEKKGLKAFFSLNMNRKKAAQKKDWEMYNEERSLRVLHGSDEKESERVAAENANVMFDVDAIRREALALALAGGDVEEIKSHLQIREIESTMPALKVSVREPVERLDGEDDALQRSQTHNGVMHAHQESGVSNEELPNGVNGDATLVQQGHEDRGDDGEGHKDGVRHDEENVTLSFDPPDRPTINGFHDNTASEPNLGPARADKPERPPLRSVQTTPAPAAGAAAAAATSAAHAVQSPASATSPDHNPWADGEFGEEKAVEMSFE